MKRTLATELDYSQHVNLRPTTGAAGDDLQLDTAGMTGLGWDARRSAEYRRHHRPDQCPARVTRVEPGVCTLLGPDGVGRASVAGRLLVAAARDAAHLPCPGDWVVVRTWPDARRTVEAVLPRRGSVWRTAGPGPSASNVDMLMTVDGWEVHPVDALRALAAPGRTLGLVGADPRSRAAIVCALAGATVLPPLGGVLLPLPAGGAVIDLHGDAPAGARGSRPGSPGGPMDPPAVVGIHWSEIGDSTGGEPSGWRSTCADAR
jgi:hypothetical protein